MEKNDINISDLERILTGENPWLFLVEVFVRTVLIYLLLYAVLRLLGKRMNAQMTITEMAVMITLGAIVSVPMQITERGILPTFVALLCTIAFQRGLNLWAFNNGKVEAITQGEVSLIIKDGCLQMKAFDKSNVTREQVFSQLRKQKVQHLGQLERVYFEACGHFSIFKHENIKPGLSILPQQDKKLWEEQPKADGHFSCFRCGNTIEAENEPDQTCNNCDDNHWVHAMDVKEKQFD
ncbi:DUF421 domain-containing protein [Pontibacter qinzhouensis]|uniref:DUF421 domain-containing protein n=1 Tax=Pontibacter qinzhouensis TaxID=2603253 RepID=A0A5C8KCY2_9BACT|nr:YetF domain-containing protein [Pontibacter qinzhouensis]TXK52638.1 DUF421 domain-containing protein [Pontibacter qinzhouensis]